NPGAPAPPVNVRCSIREPAVVYRPPKNPRYSPRGLTGPRPAVSMALPGVEIVAHDAAVFGRRTPLATRLRRGRQIAPLADRRARARPVRDRMDHARSAARPASR